MGTRRRLARWFSSAALAAMVGLACLPARGQTPSQPPTSGPAEPKFPDFNTVIKDMEATSGLFTLYRYRSDDPLRDGTKLLCQIPRSLLKQDLMLATSISRGEMAGFMWSTYLIRFEMAGRQVKIVVPDARFVQTPGQPVTDAISRTYTSSFLAAMPIITMAPGGNPVVDLGPVLMGANVGLPSSGAIGGAPRRDLSEYTKVKVFQDNALIDVDLALSGRGGGGQTIGISYAFRRLPAQNAYKPRAADERVGYFTTVRQDWNIRHTERENVIRYVNRWDLKKKDASLELSPPDKPIVFVIEKTVPLQWRKYVSEGILEWNKAFEKLGIVGAIVVQQQTEDNEFADVDPEDARYNFIRWIVTGRAFAMGPSRADPRTGQILDADIIFDDAMLRAYHGSFDVFGPRPASAVLGPELLEFLKANPSFIPVGQTLEQVHEAARSPQTELLHDAPADAPPAVKAARTSIASSYAACNYAEGIKHQLAILHTVAAAVAPGQKLPERLMGEVIREIVTHEVGHTLGLRHNFRASGWLSLEEIRQRRDTTDDATSSSVMDYNPVLFFPGDEPDKVRHLISPVIGPYDYWAIEYGYRTPASEDGGEAKMLAKIAAQNTRPEHAYATDEDTMGLSSPDPLSNRFDMGSDPVEWARMRSALCDDLLKDIRKWAVKSGDPGHYLRDTFSIIMSEKARNMLYVSRVVGGQYHSRNRPGDPDARPALLPVEPQRQRDALAALADTVFRDDFFAIEAELLNELVPSRWRDWTSSPPSRLDFPVHQMVGSFQSYVLLNLCSPQIIQRIYDAELKSKADDKFTTAELIIAVRDIVWGSLDVPNDVRFTDSAPLLSSIRRNLQRQHLQYMLAIVDSEPGALTSPDVQSMVRFSLRELADDIAAALDSAKNPSAGSRLDFASRAHLTECRSQIERVLNAPHIQVPQPRIMMLGVAGHEQTAPQD